MRPPGQTVVLAPARSRPPIITVDAADARKLCGRPLEWVEALG